MSAIMDGVMPVREPAAEPSPAAREKRPRSCLAAAELMGCFFIVNWIGGATLLAVSVLSLLGVTLSAAVQILGIGTAILATLSTAGLCCVCFLGWLRLIHADVRDATGGRHAISPKQAVWPMCVPIFNVFWLHRTLTALASTIWSGCRVHGIRCRDIRLTRRMLTAVLASLLACFLLMVIGVLLTFGMLGARSYLLSIYPGAWCIVAAGAAFLLASILLMLSAYSLSRDVDRLHKARTQVDPNAVVPVEGSRP